MMEIIDALRTPKLVVDAGIRVYSEASILAMGGLDVLLHYPSRPSNHCKETTPCDQTVNVKKCHGVFV